MGYSRYCSSSDQAMTLAEVQEGTIALRVLARLSPDHFSVLEERPNNIGIALGTKRKMAVSDEVADREGLAHGTIESVVVDAIEFLPEQDGDDFRLSQGAMHTKTYGDPPLDPLVKVAYELLRDAAHGKLVLSCDADTWDEKPPRH